MQQRQSNQTKACEDNIIAFLRNMVTHYKNSNFKDDTSSQNYCDQILNKILKLNNADTRQQKFDDLEQLRKFIEDNKQNFRKKGAQPISINGESKYRYNEEFENILHSFNIVYDVMMGIAKSAELQERVKSYEQPDHDLNQQVNKALKGNVSASLSDKELLLEKITRLEMLRDYIGQSRNKRQSDLLTIQDKLASSSSDSNSTDSDNDYFKKLEFDKDHVAKLNDIPNLNDHLKDFFENNKKHNEAAIGFYKDKVKILQGKVNIYAEMLNMLDRKIALLENLVKAIDEAINADQLVLDQEKVVNQALENVKTAVNLEKMVNDARNAAETAAKIVTNLEKSHASMEENNKSQLVLDANVSAAVKEKLIELKGKLTVMQNHAEKVKSLAHEAVAAREAAEKAAAEKAAAEKAAAEKAAAEKAAAEKAAAAAREAAEKEAAAVQVAAAVPAAGSPAAVAESVSSAAVAEISHSVPPILTILEKLILPVNFIGNGKDKENDENIKKAWDGFKEKLNTKLNKTVSPAERKELIAIAVDAASSIGVKIAVAHDQKSWTITYPDDEELKNLKSNEVSFELAQLSLASEVVGLEQRNPLRKAAAKVISEATNAQEKKPNEIKKITEALHAAAKVVADPNDQTKATMLIQNGQELSTRSGLKMFGGALITLASVAIFTTTFAATLLTFGALLPIPPLAIAAAATVGVLGSGVSGITLAAGGALFYKGASRGALTESMDALAKQAKNIKNRQ